MKVTRDKMNAFLTCIKREGRSGTKLALKDYFNVEVEEPLSRELMVLLSGDMEIPLFCMTNSLYSICRCVTNWDTVEEKGNPIGIEGSGQKLLTPEEWRRQR